MGKKTGRSRGRPSRIPSEQSKFLASFWSSWDDARAANDRAVVSSFYNDLATKYLEKFGPPGGETPTPAATPSGTPNPDIQRPSDVDSTFDINTLDPALRNIGPNNPSTSHASTTLSASPPGAGIISPPSSTTPPADPSDVPQNDWGKTRSVSTNDVFLSRTVLIVVLSLSSDGLTTMGRKTPKVKSKKPAVPC